MQGMADSRATGRIPASCSKVGIDYSLPVSSCKNKNLRFQNKKPAGMQIPRQAGVIWLLLFRS